MPPFTPTAGQANVIANLVASTDSTFDFDFLSAQCIRYHTVLFLQNDLLSYVTDPANDLHHIALLAKSNVEQHIALPTDQFVSGHL